MQFYLSYLSRWPDAFTVAQAPDNQSLMGYMLGKSEGVGEG